MKFTWEVKDIQPGVRYSGENISEVWIIGYLPFEDDPVKRITSTSLEDGMVCAPQTREWWVETLNKSEYVPVKFMGSLR